VWCFMTASSHPSLSTSSVQSAPSSTSVAAGQSAAASQSAGFTELHPSTAGTDAAADAATCPPSQYSYYQQQPVPHHLYPGLLYSICVGVLSSNSDGECQCWCYLVPTRRSVISFMLYAVEVICYLLFVRSVLYCVDF